MSPFTTLRERDQPTWYALLDAFIAHQDSALPDPRETGVLQSVDRMVSRMEPHKQAELAWGLWLLEWGPILMCAWRGPGWWRRMRHLSLARRRAYLEGWRTSRFGLLRQAAAGFKSLLMLSYYTRPDAWQPIGYDGPWVGREQVAVDPVPRPEGSEGPAPEALPGTELAPPASEEG